MPRYNAWRTPVPGRLRSLALSPESAGTASAGAASAGAAGTAGALKTEPRARQEGKAVLDVGKLRLPPAEVLARLALPLIALALGFLSLTWVRESAIGQYGLIQALPIAYFVAIALVSASFVVTFASARLRYVQFGVEITALVFLLESAPAIAESEPRFAPAWLHAGFTDYVAHNGQVLPTIDARYNWPSFFTGVAMLDRTAGVHTAIELLKWWPTAIDLLYLLPMLMLAKTILKDEKKAMLAVFLFPFANWVGQDYYSPQSVAYLLYLVLLCIVLKSFGANRA